MQFVRVCIQLLNLVDWCFVAFSIWLQNCPWSCRAMNSASFDVCCMCFWKCLIPAKKIQTLMQFVRVGIQLLNLVDWCFVAFSIWLQNCPWSCRAMNSASFDVCCMCFWKCLIVAKNSNTYAVCSCLHTVAEFVVWCIVAFESGCRTVLDRVERWILHLLMCVVFVFENV